MKWVSFSWHALKQHMIRKCYAFPIIKAMLHKIFST